MRLTQRVGPPCGRLCCWPVLVLAGGPSCTPKGRIRIAQQFGVVYLLLNVAQELRLIEKHGKAQGVGVQVEFVRLSGGGAVNDALLAGPDRHRRCRRRPAADDLGPHRTASRSVRGVASLGNFPFYLVSNNPAVKTIADFGDKDRIALPAVGVSVQSRVLQLASRPSCGATPSSTGSTGCQVARCRTPRPPRR
jgi:NitT/TauT family transport system substrate-binding protein